MNLRLTKTQLAISALFGVAFGLVEAIANLYIHAYIASATNFSATLFSQTNSLAHLSSQLLFLENFRQIGLIVMMLCLALIAAKKWTDRLGIFFWSYAIAFLSYYASLYFLIKWPTSLLNNDILSWIIKPIYGQVWFPVLISTLLIIIILFLNKPSGD